MKDEKTIIFNLKPPDPISSWIIDGDEIKLKEDDGCWFNMYEHPSIVFDKTWGVAEERSNMDWQKELFLLPISSSLI